MSGSMKDKFLKEHELSLENLEKVTGGTGGSLEQNPDGTYNLYDGQRITFDPTKDAYVVGTYLNATGKTVIYYHVYLHDLNGTFRDEKEEYDCLSNLLPMMS